MGLGGLSIGLAGSIYTVTVPIPAPNVNLTDIA